MSVTGETPENQRYVYHPQTDRLVKQTEADATWVVNKQGQNCDLLLPYILFTILETCQVSTGFTPFELLIGQHSQGLMDGAQEAWEKHTSYFCSFLPVPPSFRTQTKSFTVHTNNSVTGLVTVPLQTFKGEQNLLLYMSRKLSVCEYQHTHHHELYLLNT